MDSKKSIKIRDIVKLQQILKKWRKLANSSETRGRSSIKNSSSKSIRFLKRTLSLSDRSEASSNVVPKGYLAVSVGEDLQRFVIPTHYLGHEAFKILLREAEEEFGFQQAGVLRIPCEVSLFESILMMVEQKRKKFFMKECRSSVEDLAESQLTLSHQCPMCR